MEAVWVERLLHRFMRGWWGSSTGRLAITPLTHSRIRVTISHIILATVISTFPPILGCCWCLLFLLIKFKNYAVGYLKKQEQNIARVSAYKLRWKACFMNILLQAGMICIMQLLMVEWRCHWFQIHHKLSIKSTAVKLVTSRNWVMIDSLFIPRSMWLIFFYHKFFNPLFGIT